MMIDLCHRPPPPLFFFSLLLNFFSPSPLSFSFIISLPVQHHVAAYRTRLALFATHIGNAPLTLFSAIISLFLFYAMDFMEGEREGTELEGLVLGCFPLSVDIVALRTCSGMHHITLSPRHLLLLFLFFSPSRITLCMPMLVNLCLFFSI